MNDYMYVKAVTPTDKPIVNHQLLVLVFRPATFWTQQATVISGESSDKPPVPHQLSAAPSATSSTQCSTQQPQSQISASGVGGNHKPS